MVEENEDEEANMVTMDGMLSSTLLSVIRDRVNITLTDEDATYIENRSSEYNLFMACETGDMRLARSIIDEESGNSDLMYSEDDECNTLVHAAVLSNNQNLLKYTLIDLELDANTHNVYRMSPLHLASMAQYKDMARILLNHGANVNQQDISGRTPLIISCQKNDIDICNLLLDHNASIRSFDINGDNAIHHTCRGRCTSILRTLLASVSVHNIDAVNSFGETALHVSCNAGSTINRCVRLLLQKNADVKIKTKADKKAVDEVSTRDPNRTRLIALLRET